MNLINLRPDATPYSSEFQRGAILTLLCCLLAFSACARKKTSCDDFLLHFRGAYSGVALATKAGDLTFAGAPKCGVSISSSYGDLKEVSRAWERSPYDGVLRPLYIEATGRIRIPENDKQSLIFDVDDLSTVSSQVSPMEARSQFKLRANRSLPKFRSSEGN